MPTSYMLYKAALRMGIPLWELEDAMLDPRRRKSAYRALEFSRMEASVKVTKT